MIEVHSQTLFGPQVRDLAFRPPAREAKCEFVINMKTSKIGRRRAVGTVPNPRGTCTKSTRCHSRRWGSTGGGIHKFRSGRFAL